MSIWDYWFGARKAAAASPQAAFQSAGGGLVISTSQELEEALREGTVSASGVGVTPDKAMRVATVYACVRILSGAVATLPLSIKRRVDDKTRLDASDTALWKVLRRKPNRWMTPLAFKRMMTAHILLSGKAHALKVMSRGELQELIPLHPDRVEKKQHDDLSLSFTYTRKDGRKVEFSQEEVFDLVGLTLDGVHGVSPIKMLRETVGLSIAMEEHGANVFRNGARVSSTLTHPGKLGEEGRKNLGASLDEFRSGGEKDGKSLILEEGMKFEPIAMTAQDAQWIESRQFSQADILMVYGIPPHMVGLTSKSTSWGTGIEQQDKGFTAYGLDDHLVMWEETIDRDLISDDSDLFAKFNRDARVKGDIKARWDAHTKALQWGVASPNEVRAREDWNPREDGDVYYDPPNTAGGQTGDDNDDNGDGNEPPEPSRD